MCQCFGVLGFNLINLICCRKCGSKNIDYRYNEYASHQKVVGLAGPMAVASYLHLALLAVEWWGGVEAPMVDEVEDVVVVVAVPVKKRFYTHTRAF